MSNRKNLEVYMDNRKVGTLAETKDHLYAFAYSKEWLQNGFSISPFSLPLEDKVFIPRKYDPFDGLFAVFYDSLPDGWGRLLVDRLLRKNGFNPATVSSLYRLAIVGDSGMGALSYRPSEEMRTQLSDLSLDELALECSRIFEGNQTEKLDELFLMGGSSGGARPKVNYELNGEEWIVKFPSSIDRKGIGVEEYQYSLAAKACGIKMAKTMLLPSNICEGYFATKRFDRNSEGRQHMISVSALLETSHRIPNLDYNILMQLTLQLTHSYEELEQLFRLMCFNVFAHNRDDHSKNFSFLYQDGEYRLSPAYDLTYSNSIGGEHATTVNGNGENPGIDEILQVAKLANMDVKKAELIAMEIREMVEDKLGKFLTIN